MNTEPIYLTTDELYGITGLRRASAQFRWFISNGFKAVKRANGFPVVSRAHFLVVMGGIRFETYPDYPEPDFDALP